MVLKVLLLHMHPEYLLQCCKLINSEWNRSETARLRSLELSRDELPTSLILTLGNNVIGHCKLSPIPSIRDACFVETVVIDKNLRGKGHGRFLMLQAEEYCKTVLRLKMVYLSTIGQEGFYSKLGYKKCEPISIYGSFTPIAKPPLGFYTATRKLSDTVITTNVPAPPPMPNNFSNNNNINRNKKIYMNKILL